MCPFLAWKRWVMCPITHLFHHQSREAGLHSKEQRQLLKCYCLGQEPAFIPSPFLPSKQAVCPFLCKLQKSRRHASYKRVHNILQQAHRAREQFVQGQRKNFTQVPLCQRKVSNSQVLVTHECWLLGAAAIAVQKEQEGKCRAPWRQKNWKQNKTKKSIQLNWARADKEQRVRRQSRKQ